jgi:peroxiredoxin
MGKTMVVVAGILFASAAGYCCAAGAHGTSAGGAGEKAPDFTLADLKGGTVSLKDYTGKVVCLVFSTTWCPHCRTEIPELKKLHAKYGDKGFVLLNIDVQESAKKVSAFAEKQGIPYRVLLDEDGKVTKAYGIRGVPFTVIVGRDGTVVCKPCRSIEPVIEKLLGDGGEKKQ